MVAKSRIEPHAVHGSLVLADRDGMLRGVDEPVALSQVVVLGRLIVNIRDNTIALRAKCIVLWFVREATRGENADALPRPIGTAHVVKVTIVVAVKRACGGVGCDTRIAGLIKNVAWTFDSGGGSGGGQRKKARGW